MIFKWINIQKNVVLLMIVPLLYAIGSYHYLIFHTMVEVFAIVVVALVYVIAVRSSKYSQDNLMLFLGNAYFFVALFLFLHLSLIYVSPVYGQDVSTQILIGKRFLEAAIVAIAPFFVRRKFVRRHILILYLFITVILAALIIFYHVFPKCYVAGSGFASFGITADYLILAILLMAALHFYSRKDQINAQLFWSMSFAITFFLLSEICFSLVGNEGFLCIKYEEPLFIIGQIFQAVQYYLVFIGVVLRGLEAPFRDATARRRAEEEIEIYKGRLRSLAAELTVVEEKERRRIAIDIHDSIGQFLAVSKIRMGSLRERLTSLGLAVNELDEIRRLINYSIKYTRALTFELSPPMLYERGFEEALEWLGQSIYERSGIEIYVDNDGLPKPLSDDIKVILFKSVRELITNILKHSGARKAKVTVLKSGQRIRVTVEDDGLGFDVSNMDTNYTESGGFGLFSISERLKCFDGSIGVQSKPGQGTKVVLEAPLKMDNLPD